MLPGCDGHLVSAAFLERQSAKLTEVAWMDQRRRLDEWRGVTRMLGPASSPAAMLQTSASPLMEILGFDKPERVEPLERVAVPMMLRA